MRKPIIHSLRLALLLPVLLPLTLHAQQADSLAAARSFLHICHSYKRLPLQMRITMTSSTNLVTKPEDTLHLDAAFYLDEHGSYTRMGDMEQLANDSLLLLVSPQAHQMLLYANHRSPAAQLQSYLGLNMTDSSVTGFAQKYMLREGARQGKSGSYVVSSRTLLPGTGLPRETIEVLYNPVVMEPLEFVQRRRSLVSVDSTDYSQFSALPEWKGRLVKLPGNSYWLLKEVATVFRYTAITHKKNQPLPARINDRIVATGPGVYAPVKKYEQFLLNQFPDQDAR